MRIDQLRCEITLSELANYYLAVHLHWFPAEYVQIKPQVQLKDIWVQFNYYVIIMANKLTLDLSKLNKLKESTH